MKKKNGCSAAFYLRVSTEEQANLGYGLNVQRSALEAFVSLHDYVVEPKHIYVDEGQSGTLPPEKRPALTHLLEDAARKQFDTVLVYKVDRLARDNFITIGVVRELEKLGIAFGSATEPFDTTNTFGSFMLQFLGATAEMDRKNILERTQKGRWEAAKAGKWVWSSPAYGYKLNPKTQKLEIDEEQARWVKQFFEWLVYDQWSLKAIARQANALKVQTKLVADGSPRASTGLWYPRTLGRMLTNELYTGKTHFRKYKKGRVEIKTLGNEAYLREKEEWIAIEVHPIVSRELYDAAVVQLRRNSVFAKRNRIHSYMFSGLLHCHKCGYRFRGGYSKPRTPNAEGSKYYFSFVMKKDRDRTKKCRYCGSVAERKLMSIWCALVNILSDPHAAYDSLERYSSNFRGDELVEKVRMIDRSLASREAEKERLHRAYIEICSISEQTYRTRLDDLTKRQAALLGEKQKYEHLVVSEEEKRRRVDQIGQLHRKLKSRLAEPSYDTRTKILRLLVNRIDLQPSQSLAVVEFNFPDGHLKDINGESCPSANFNLVVEVPLVSFAEV